MDIAEEASSSNAHRPRHKVPLMQDACNDDGRVSNVACGAVVFPAVIAPTRAPLTAEEAAAHRTSAPSTLSLPPSEALNTAHWVLPCTHKGAAATSRRVKSSSTCSAFEQNVGKKP
jgi:hypothetical protein